VDVFSYDQAIAFLNDFHWQPRPVFQSYTVYRPRLVEANRRFLASAQAPPFLLFKAQPIDGRPLALEDSEALLEMLRRYKPVVGEKGFWLFERVVGAVPDEQAAPVGTVQRTIKLNEEVLLDGAGAHKVFLDIGCSTRGKVRSLLYKPCELSIRMRTEDGQEHTFRLIPGMAKSGFLINPLVVDEKDLYQLYSNLPPKRVLSFCIMADAQARRCYRHEVAMKLEPVQQLVSCQLSTAELNRLRYPMFDAPPEAVWSTTAVETRMALGLDVLMVHADGGMKFLITGSEHAISGHFGILPEAYERYQTDGVQFSIEYRPRQGSPRILWERYLDPLHKVSDQGLQFFSVPLPGAGDGAVVLKTGNLPGHTTNWDWSYWYKVGIN
jgi:hypothetical protein